MNAQGILLFSRPPCRCNAQVDAGRLVLCGMYGIRRATNAKKSEAPWRAHATDIKDGYMSRGRSEFNDCLVHDGRTSS